MPGLVMCCSFAAPISAYMKVPRIIASAPKKWCQVTFIGGSAIRSSAAPKDKICAEGLDWRHCPVDNVSFRARELIFEERLPREDRSG